MRKLISQSKRGTQTKEHTESDMEGKMPKTHEMEYMHTTTTTLVKTESHTKKVVKTPFMPTTNVRHYAS